MFELFRAPRHQIRKRLPKGALAEYQSVEAFASANLAALPDVQREHAVAYVLSVWACNRAAAGTLALTPFEYRFVQNVGMNSAKLLSHDTQMRAADIVDEAKAKGLIQAG